MRRRLRLDRIATALLAVGLSLLLWWALVRTVLRFAGYA